MSIKDYIMESEFCIHIFNDRVDVVNYVSIYGFDDNCIIIKHKNGIVNIRGKNLSVNKLLDNEVLISGKFDGIEFR